MSSSTKTKTMYAVSAWHDDGFQEIFLGTYDTEEEAAQNYEGYMCGEDNMGCWNCKIVKVTLDED